MLTEGCTVADDGLENLTIVDYDVCLANGPGRDEVDGVAPEVSVGEKLRPVPYSGILAHN